VLIICDFDFRWHGKLSDSEAKKINYQLSGHLSLIATSTFFHCGT